MSLTASISPAYLKSSEMNTFIDSMAFPRSLWHGVMLFIPTSVGSLSGATRRAVLLEKEPTGRGLRLGLGLGRKGGFGIGGFGTGSGARTRVPVVDAKRVYKL